MAISASNPLLNPGVPLTGNALWQAAMGLANAQTQPVLQGLAQQLAQNDQRTRATIGQVGGYYKGLGQQAQHGLDAQTLIGANLNNQLAQIGQQEQQQLGQIGQNATSSLKAYTPQSDAQGSLAQPALQGLATEIARQQGLAAQNQGAFRSFGANQGANYQGLAASNLGTFAQQGEQGLKGIAQAGQLRDAPLSQKIAQVKGDYGNILATDLGKLRQQEITNNITAQGLGIRQQSANTAAKTAAFNTNPNAVGSPAWGRGQTAKTQAWNDNPNNVGSSAWQRAHTNDPTAVGSPAWQRAHNDNPSTVGSPAWSRVQNANGKQWSTNPAAVGSPAWSRVQRANAATNGGNAKPLTSIENNHFWQTVGQIQQLIRDGQANGQQGKINGYLQSGQNPSKRSFDPFLIKVADELLGYGSIDQSTAAILHNQYGVRGGTFRGKPIKVTANYSPASTRQNPSGTAGGVGAALTTAGNAAGRALGG